MTNLDQYRAYWTARFAAEPVEQVVTHMTPAQYADYYRPILDAVQPPGEVRVIFDAGCGPGLLLPLLRERWPNAWYEGYDISPEVIARAREIHKHDGNAVFTLTQDAAPSFVSAGADFIIAHSIVTHIYPDDAVTLLRNIRAALLPAGRASISIHMCDAGVQGNIHTIRYAPALFEAMVAQAGLRIVAQVDGQLPPTAGPQRYYSCEVA